MMIKALLFFLACISAWGCDPTSKAGNNKPGNDSIPSDKSLALQPDKCRAIFEKGIDFLATGNEPFWSLEIDFDKSMHFKTPDGYEMITSAVEGVKAMDANVIRYQATTEKGELTVQIQKLECINDMSGEKVDYNVTINTKYSTGKDYVNYKGCGRYLADYRLHDIWVLDSINNKKIQASEFTKGIPQLEFNLTEKKIFGHTGCNNLNGTIEVLGKRIYFARLATTRMACPDMDFESAYLRKLDNKILPYQITSLKLRLLVGADSLFIYRKVD